MLNSDLEMYADEMRDYEDQDPHIPPTSTATLLPVSFKTCDPRGV
jgi:hypothetical protein